MVFKWGLTCAVLVIAQQMAYCGSPSHLQAAGSWHGGIIQQAPVGSQYTVKTKHATEPSGAQQTVVQHLPLTSANGYTQQYEPNTQHSGYQTAGSQAQHSNYQTSGSQYTNLYNNVYPSTNSFGYHQSSYLPTPQLNNEQYSSQQASNNEQLYFPPTINNQIPTFQQSPDYWKQMSQSLSTQSTTNNTQITPEVIPAAQQGSQIQQQVSTASTQTEYHPTSPKQSSYDDSYPQPIQPLSGVHHDSYHKGELPPGYLGKHHGSNLPTYGTYDKSETPTKSTYQSYPTPKKEDRTKNHESSPVTLNNQSYPTPEKEDRTKNSESTPKTTSTQIAEEIIGYTPPGEKNSLHYPHFYQTADLYGNTGEGQYAKPGSQSVEEIVSYASDPAEYFGGSSAHDKPQSYPQPPTKSYSSTSDPAEYFGGSSAHDKPQSYPQPPTKSYSSGSDRSDNRKQVHIYSPIFVMCQKPRGKAPKHGYGVPPFHDSPSYQCPPGYSCQPIYEHSYKTNYEQGYKPKYQLQRSPAQKKGGTDNESYAASPSKFHSDAGAYASGADYQKPLCAPSYQQNC